MRILSRNKIVDYVKKHNQSKNKLMTIYNTLTLGTYKNSQEIIDVFPKASQVPKNCIVFRKGNDYRMIIQFDYSRQIGFIKFIGSHNEYDVFDKQKLQTDTI